MKYTREGLENSAGVEELRQIVRSLGGTPRLLKKNELINIILKLQRGEMLPDQEQTKRGRKPRNAKAGIEDLPNDIEKEPIIEVKDSEEGLLKEGVISIKGILELHTDGYGFLRGDNYSSDPSSDVHVSKNTIRYFRLRRGDYIEGTAERQRDNNTPSLKSIKTLNGMPFNQSTSRPSFDDLVACYPDKRITMELKADEGDISMRAIDLLCPIGKGQRGLIVAPPKAGKTTLIKKIAKSIEVNNPEIHLIVLLIDERPEEVTDLKRSVKGEVIYSTFDEIPDNHIRAAELVLNRSKRLVEIGKDVVILIDSITKLTRAYNAIVPSSGKTLSGGIDPIALHAPKKFFGAARNIENGGSLTILSTALIETGSKMDEVIYEEFKGTGNMEIILSRQLSERRIFPAIDLYRSGTRKDELLLSESEQDAVFAIRRYLDKDDNAMQNLLDMLKRTENNEEFVSKAPVWCKMMSNQSRS